LAVAILHLVSACRCIGPDSARERHGHARTAESAAGREQSRHRELYWWPRRFSIVMFVIAVIFANLIEMLKGARISAGDAISSVR